MKKYSENNDYVRKNEQIRHHRVLVVHDGNKLGEMSSRDAQFKARELGLDLVEVSPNSRPPVCSIMDYGKFQYEKSKKQQASSVVKEKEFSLRYVIDDHDLQTKMNQAKKFLEKGDRVKIIIKFKARENAHREEGWEVINKAVGMLAEVGSPEKPPAMDGNRIVVKLVKKKAA
jgi:translation initiation factor IF-3